MNTSSGRSTGSSKHECSQESPGEDLVSPTRQAGSPPSQLLGKLALTLLCLDLRQHSLQQCQRLPVVLSLHFYQLRKHKNKPYPLPKANSLLQWHPFSMKALACEGTGKTALSSSTDNVLQPVGQGGHSRWKFGGQEHQEGMEEST